MGACATEFSSLPLLAGCPSDDEYFLVGNAIGGLGAGGYARRRYADLKSCILAGLSFIPLQFEIGQSGSPMNDGDSDLTITVDNPCPNSQIVLLDNTPLTPNLTTQISYTVSYSLTEIIITFNQPVSNGQKYFITYATY
jgi:hypothetical protein